MAEKKSINVNKKSSFKYTGKVTIEVKKKEKAVNSKLLFNKGTPDLFQFICLCLAGNNVDASPLRPLYLNIFNYSGDEGDIDYTSDFTDKKNLTRIIPNTAINDVNPLLDEYDNTIGYSVIYSFTVPLNQLIIDTTATENTQLNLLGLFNSRSEYPAAYILVKDENNNVTSVIPHEIFVSATDMADYVLSIN